MFVDLAVFPLDFNEYHLVLLSVFKPFSSHWFLSITREYMKPQVSDIFTVHRVYKENNGLKW